MTFVRAGASTAVLLASLLGCGTDTRASEVGAQCQGVLSDNRLAANKLTANRLVGNKLAANRLAANRLAANRLAANRLVGNKLTSNRLAGNRLAANRLVGNRLAANCLPVVTLALDTEIAGELISTPDGRELLGYVVGCAFSAEQVLVADHEGEHYELAGSIGLAPQWGERALTASEQRWVSACLLARVNAHDQSIEISMRGPHPALTVDSTEAAEWSLEEGAFWGNVFAPEDQAIDWNACEGTDQEVAEAGDLAARDCTEPEPDQSSVTQCGFRFAGACGGRAASTAACAGYDAEGQFYTECGAHEAEQPAFAEVITTFVRP